MLGTNVVGVAFVYCKIGLAIEVALVSSRLMLNIIIKKYVD